MASDSHHEFINRSRDVITSSRAAIVDSEMAISRARKTIARTRELLECVERDGDYYRFLLLLLTHTPGPG
jgi:hypothetical protein